MSLVVPVHERDPRGRIYEDGSRLHGAAERVGLPARAATRRGLDGAGERHQTAARRTRRRAAVTTPLRRALREPHPLRPARRPARSPFPGRSGAQPLDGVLSYLRGPRADAFRANGDWSRRSSGPSCAESGFSCGDSGSSCAESGLSCDDSGLSRGVCDEARAVQAYGRWPVMGRGEKGEGRGWRLACPADLEEATGWGEGSSPLSPLPSRQSDALMTPSQHNSC
jgi:hypothetical protein